MGYAQSSFGTNIADGTNQEGGAQSGIPDVLATQGVWLHDQIGKVRKRFYSHNILYVTGFEKTENLAKTRYERL